MELYVIDLRNLETEYRRLLHVECNGSDIGKVRDIFKKNMNNYFNDPDGKELYLEIITKSKAEIERKGIEIKFLDPLWVEVLYIR